MAIPFIIDDRTPVTLLTGFLGSGKTTVLNRLLQHSDLADTAVIINEFGEIGLDHDLVQTSTENLVLLQSGCLCCTVRGDLIDTLNDLSARSRRGEIKSFDRVMIETTGLADPVPILQSLMSDPMLALEFRLDGIITTVDAALGSATLDQQIESVKQIAVADRILLTKTDIAGLEAVRALEARMATINPGAPIIRVHNGVVVPSRIFDVGIYDPATKTEDVQAWLNAEAFAAADASTQGTLRPQQARNDVNRHDDRIRSASLTVDEPIPMSVFDVWLDALTALLGPNLLRLKGLVRVEELGGPFVLHAVQHVFHPPVHLPEWPSSDKRTRLVVIGRDLDPKLLSDSLEFLRGTARPRRRPPAPAGVDVSAWIGSRR